jgi:hypothetical protein
VPGARDAIIQWRHGGNGACCLCGNGTPVSGYVDSGQVLISVPICRVCRWRCLRCYLDYPTYSAAGSRSVVASAIDVVGGRAHGLDRIHSSVIESWRTKMLQRQMCWFCTEFLRMSVIEHAYIFFKVFYKVHFLDSITLFIINTHTNSRQRATNQNIGTRSFWAQSLLVFGYKATNRKNNHKV